MSRVLAVDLGGTQMRAALVDHDGRLLVRRAQPTPRDAACPDALLLLVGGVMEGAGVQDAVIGVPGRVTYGSGVLEYAPNLPPGWAAALTEAALSLVLGLRVWLANDADLAGVGEARFGAGRGHADVVYATVSTGIGAGVVLGGLLAHGRRSLAEAGHTIIDRAAVAAGAPVSCSWGRSAPRWRVLGHATSPAGSRWCGRRPAATPVSSARRDGPTPSSGRRRAMSERCARVRLVRHGEMDGRGR